MTTFKAGDRVRFIKPPGRGYSSETDAEATVKSVGPVYIHIIWDKSNHLYGSMDHGGYYPENFELVLPSTRWPVGTKVRLKSRPEDTLSWATVVLYDTCYGVVKLSNGVYASPDVLEVVPEPVKTPVTDMLDIIDTFLARHDDHARDLWNVLSALRGPDGVEIKASTTSPIRKKAFPQMWAVLEAKHGISILPVAMGLMSESPVDGSHFGSHVRAARHALAKHRG